MNRQQRRAAQRNQPAYKRLNHDQLMNALAKKGITSDDLRTARQEAYRNGVESAVVQCYAAICLALNEQFGFGRERVLRALRAVDDKVIFAVESAEMVEEVFNRFGIRMDFRDGLERVQEN